jgi:catechol 2,3-dioxygenase-like lactoylglutathione lyase family enzyme
VNVVGIDHIQLAMPAGQEDEARRFYAGLLGLTEVAKPSHLVARGGAWFENATVTRLQATTYPKVTCVRPTSTPTSRTRSEIGSN